RRIPSLIHPLVEINSKVHRQGQCCRFFAASYNIETGTFLTFHHPGSGTCWIGYKTIIGWQVHSLRLQQRWRWSGSSGVVSSSACEIYCQQILWQSSGQKTPGKAR